MTNSHYSTAEQYLLAPYDLTSNKLESVFGELFGHRLDYADLYFQYARSEAWSLEEGIVKSGAEGDVVAFLVAKKFGVAIYSSVMGLLTAIMSASSTTPFL